MANLPAVVQNRAMSIGAGWWLDALPELIETLADEWNITMGDSYDGGTEAYVAQAEMANGEPAVLKLLIPREHQIETHEITVLQLADGGGCPKLYRHDVARRAMLMERLGPSLFDLGLPLGRRHRILCDTAAALWRPAPDCGLPTGAEKAAWLIDYITTAWDELGRPCSEGAVAHALACASRRAAAHDHQRAVLVHGDVNEWNALIADGGYKLVDPDGLLAEAEYDLGIIMREDPVELMADGDPRARSRWLADRTGLDEVAIWEWGVVERVSTGLTATRIDLQPVGRQMLEAADQIAGLEV